MRVLHPRWPLLAALIAGVGILVALTYLPSEQAGAPTVRRGGAYTEGVAGGPQRINPLFASFNDVDQDLVALTFSGLMRFGANGAVEPDLIEEPPRTPDARTYIFRLREGLVWHDGEPLTSRDVAFTVGAIQAPDFQGDPVLADLFQDVEVTVPDERTVIMALPQAFAPFLARGATVGILPEHLLGDLDADGLFDAAFNSDPVGSGPFRVAELSPVSAVLEPFSAYHFDEPRLGQIILRFYRDDGELLNAVSTEAVDGALFRPGLSDDDLAFIDGDARWVRRELHGTPYNLVYLNLAAPAFEEAEVRRALQNSLDRELLVETALEGQALLLDSPIVRDMWAYEGSPSDYEFAPVRAAGLLQASGWEEVNGVRQLDGTPLAFSLAASDDPVQVEIARELARQWGEAGIVVDVQVSGASQFVENVLLTRDFEAALVTIDLGPDPDPYPFWHSTQVIGEGRNLSGYADTEVDTLLENARQTSSTAERAADYRPFQAIFARDLPAVLLYTPAFQYVVRAELQALSPGLLLNPSSRFAGVERWHVLGADGD